MDKRSNLWGTGWFQCPASSETSEICRGYSVSFYVDTVFTVFFFFSKAFLDQNEHNHNLRKFVHFFGSKYQTVDIEHNLTSEFRFICEIFLLARFSLGKTSKWDLIVWVWENNILSLKGGQIWRCSLTCIITVVSQNQIKICDWLGYRGWDCQTGTVSVKLEHLVTLPKYWVQSDLCFSFAKLCGCRIYLIFNPNKSKHSTVTN